jgi:hypothetical protein
MFLHETFRSIEGFRRPAKASTSITTRLSSMAKRHIRHPKAISLEVSRVVSMPMRCLCKRR